MEGDTDQKSMLGMVNLQSSPIIREWFRKRRENLRPWGTFLSTQKFGVPPSPQCWTKRVVKNVEYNQTNYMFVFIGLIVYCLVTSPLLLIAVAAFFGAIYIVSLKNGERKFVVGGQEIQLTHQYMAISVLSLPVFYFAGMGTVVFWVLGASFFFIMLHASFFTIEAIVGSDDEPLSLPPVQEV